MCCISKYLLFIYYVFTFFYEKFHIFQINNCIGTVSTGSFFQKEIFWPDIRFFLMYGMPYVLQPTKYRI